VPRCFECVRHDAPTSSGLLLGNKSGLLLGNNHFRDVLPANTAAPDHYTGAACQVDVSIPSATRTRREPSTVMGLGAYLRDPAHKHGQRLVAIHGLLLPRRGCLGRPARLLIRARTRVALVVGLYDATLPLQHAPALLGRT